VPTNNIDNFAQETWHILNSPQSSLPQGHTNESDSISNLCSNYLDLIKVFNNHNNPKVIYLHKQLPEDVNYLASLDFSPEHLLKNFTTRIGLVTHDTREFQNRAISTGYVYALCPITGEMLRSNQSIPINPSVVFYRFVGAKVFYLVTGNMGAGYSKDALYFPEDELVIRKDTHRYGFRPSHVIVLKAILVSHYQAFLDYFSDSRPKKIAILIGHPNFAHHIWNELSALYRLKEKNALNKIEQIFVMRETLGTITDIFPELPTKKVKYLNDNLSLDEETLSILENTQPIHPQIIAEIIKNNYTFVNVGDTFIPHGLTQRLYRVAKQEANPQTAQIIAQAKQECFPIIWISIRTQDRTWINQTQGLISIINALADNFPKLGIVFDGFTLSSDSSTENSRYKPTPDFLAMIAQEKAVVAEIVNNINPKLSVFNIIGGSMFEANLWAHAVDLYLCHFGTLQHKIGWLALKPGLVHCNARVSANKNSQFRSYGVREFGIPPKFLNPDDVETISVSISGDDLRTNIDNYDIDWRIIYNQMIAIIAQVEKERNWQGKVLNYLKFAQKYLLNKFAKMPYIKRYKFLRL
jgi:hypothetical protein